MLADFECTGWQSQSVQYQFTKLDRLTATDPKEGAKIILKFFLSWKQVIRKEQTTLWKEEKKPKCLIRGYWCTG